MKKFMALILTFCLAFSNLVAMAAENPKSGEASAEISAKLNEPLSEVLDPNGMITDFLKNGKINCTVKYDLSDSSSIKIQLDMSTTADITPQKMTAWVNINTANKEFATVTVITKKDGDEKYQYHTSLLKQEETNQLLIALKSMDLVDNKSIMQKYVSLLEKYGAKKDGKNISITFSPANLVKFYDDVIKLYDEIIPGYSDMLNYYNNSGTEMTDEQKQEVENYKKIMKAVAKDKLFSSNALTMNLTLSDDGTYFTNENASIHFNFNVYDLTKYVTEAMGGTISDEYMPFTQADSNVNFTVNMTSTVSNMGKTTVTQPALTADNSIDSDDAYIYDDSDYDESDYNKEIADSLTDISGHWAENDIYSVVSNGIFSGNDDNTFTPDSYMTRGMFVTALDYMNDNDEYYEAADGSFADLTDDDYYTSSAIWAAKHTIVAASGNFEPNENITREEICVMLKNYATYAGIDLKTNGTPLTFTDQGKISSWATDAVTALSDNGIISGRPDGSFDPQAPATRAEVAHIMNNFYSTFIAKG